MHDALDRHPLVVRLFSEVLPVLRVAADRLSATIPSIRVSVFAGPCGVATSFQGFHAGISCLLPDGHDIDEVALVVALCHLDREPRIDADVCWGHPSGQSEMTLWGAVETSDLWPLATPERERELHAALPRLVEALETAVRRGHP